MKLRRSSGILAHCTSFPSEYGIGDLGASAREFIDFLHEGRQSFWQILPLSPTGYGDSPYQSSSTFAMNELLICPDSPPIAELLPEKPAAFNPAQNPMVVDYGSVIPFKHTIYRKAFANYKKSNKIAFTRKFSAFCKKHAGWLDDFALFTAIKKHFIEERRNTYDSPEFKAYKKKNLKALGSEELAADYFYGAVWNSWPESLARRETPALKEYADMLSGEIEYVKFLQFCVFSQWDALKAYANKQGVEIIGDLPIFVAYDSADCWVHRELFLMKGFDPDLVAGVPPDYFSETGQLWGNPLYDWDAHKKDSYKWWFSRLSHVLSSVDIVRIDHFRGFEGFWAIPYGAKNAVKGKWLKAPGMEFFTALSKEIPNARIIAEDLGVITKEVTALRENFNYPGMVILQFGMEDGPDGGYIPHNFDTSHIVAYTGTHDNNTTLGWYNSMPDKVKDYFRRYMNVSGDAPHWDLIRLMFASSAKLAVAPIQDILGLDEKHRMNTPGEPSGNWQFRYTSDMLTESAAAALKYLSELFGRNERIDESKNKGL